MPLAFVGAAVHAPGITSRPGAAADNDRAVLLTAYSQLRQRIEQARLDALVVVSAEHFTNFFMNNMPSFCIGLAERYEGPSEDEAFLKIPKGSVPGAARLARRLADAIRHEVDLSCSQELLLDHGIMVPLHLVAPENRLPIVPIIVNCLVEPLPPLARCFALGRALRKAADERPERIGVLAAGGLSHWPAVPESGRLNVDFDRAFVADFVARDRARLTRYSDGEIVALAGPGGHEIRSWIAAAAASEGAETEVLCFTPIAPYAVTACVTASALPTAL